MKKFFAQLFNDNNSINNNIKNKNEFKKLE